MTAGVLLSVNIQIVPMPGITEEMIHIANHAAHAAIVSAQATLNAHAPQPNEQLMQLAHEFAVTHSNESLRGSMLYDWAVKFQAALKAGQS